VHCMKHFVLGHSKRSFYLIQYMFNGGRFLGLQHAKHFRDGARWVRQMIEHVHRDNTVERAILEGKSDRIGLLASDLCERKVLAARHRLLGHTG
jgi:hypothetical protein